jgi:hypothetical protein
MSYWHLLLQCTINLLVIPLAILNTLWFSALSAVYTFYMVVELHLYFLFDRHYCEEDWRSLSQAMKFAMPKTHGHKLTQTWSTMYVNLHLALPSATISVHKSSKNVGCHHKILGTWKVKWSKFQHSEPTNIRLHHTKFHHQATWHPDLCTSKYSEIKLKIWHVNKHGTLNLHHMKCKLPNRITHSVQDAKLHKN